MELEIGPHLEEAELEQYSMGNLPETRLEAFEGHFLVCDQCQDRLLEMESYVDAMRSASPKVRPAPRKLLGEWRHPQLKWVAAFAMGAAAAAAGVWMVVPPQRVEMAAVTLQASRGITGPPAAAPAGKVLILKIDLTELPQASSYRLEVVDMLGSVVWGTWTTTRHGVIEQAMAKALGQGQYFARLYSPNGRLLREFSLGVQAR